jgi:chorismate mutase
MSISQKNPFIIAGPCSAESPEQMLAVARELENIPAVHLFRAGIWKPRTRPGSFEGIGAIGLPWLKKIKEETRLKTCTEVARASHVEEVLKHDVDVLWIGARTTANPFSVQEICDALRGVDIPVMVKNPTNPDLALWLGAIERLEMAGIKNVSAIFRGFSTYETDSRFRNKPIWRIPVELKRRRQDLPLICDPSHISGNRELVSELCQKAVNLNFDGLMLEVHPNPEQAWSDAAQQITPTQLQTILSDLTYSKEHVDNTLFDLELEKWRNTIDIIDKEILDALAARMKVVEKIGEEKKKNGITALQLQRLDKMLKERIDQARKIGLSEELAHDIYHLIHENSVKRQIEIMKH